LVDPPSREPNWISEIPVPEPARRMLDLWNAVRIPVGVLAVQPGLFWSSQNCQEHPEDSDGRPPTWTSLFFSNGTAKIFAAFE